MDNNKISRFEVKVGAGKKFAYGLGELAQNLANGAVTIFFLMFCTEVAGLNAGVIGTLLLLGRFWDMINDTWVGSWTDRTKSKYGRYRPWILWSCVPLAILTILLFWNHESMSVGAKTVYVYIMYFAWCLAYTCINIPHTTMVAALTQDGAERASIAGWKLAFTNVGMTFGGACTMPIVMRMSGGGADMTGGWLKTVSLFMVISVIFSLICFKVCTEVVEPKDDQDKMPILKGAALALKNKQFVIILIGAFLLAVINLGRATAQTYYFMYIVGDMGKMSLFAIVTGVAGALGAFTMPIWSNTLRSKGKAIAYSSFLGAVGLILMSIGDNTMGAVFWIGTFIAYYCFFTGLSASLAACPDCAEYALLETEIRQEGLYGAYWSFCNKAGIALGSASVGWMLAGTGYVANQAEQAPAVISGINAIFLIVPLILSIVVGIVMLFYKIDYDKYEEILQEQKARGLIKEEA